MKIIQLNQIRDIIRSNSIIAIGGFTINRKPIAIIKEIAGSEADNLALYTLAGSLDLDLLVEKNKVSKIMAAYAGYEGLGISKTVRHAVESGQVIFEDLTEILYYFRLKAGAIGAPFISTSSIIKSDIFHTNPACKKVKNPFTGEELCAVKSINPDFSIIHAQKADKFGNIRIEESDFCEKEMAQASKIKIFSVEKIVSRLKPSEITIPSQFVDYVVPIKKGAYPTGCYNHYYPDIKKILNYLNQDEK